jgi:hypothetical protein
LRMISVSSEKKKGRLFLRVGKESCTTMALSIFLARMEAQTQKVRIDFCRNRSLEKIREPGNF